MGDFKIRNDANMRLHRSTLPAVAFSLLVSAILPLAAISLLASCATAGSSAAVSSTPPSASAQDVFAGTGENPSFGEAINAAKIDAIRKAVIQLIGQQAEQTNQDRIRRALYETRNPNAFVYLDSMQTVRKENLGSIDKPDFLYEIRIRVNTSAVMSVLDSEGIGRTSTPSQTAEAPGAAGGSDTATAAAVRNSSPGASPAGQAPQVVETGKTDLGLQQGDLTQATDEQKRFIRRYVDSMTYMVYADENSKTDPFLMKLAVTQADSFLATKGMTAIDAAQIESLKKDQKLVYEQETGKNVGIVQWIAQKLNADVYVEIDAETSAELQGGNYYGAANVTLKMYETSTGQLLGSIPFRSQRTMSTVSEKDALANAVQSAVWQAMPVVVDQSRELLARAFARGIRFDLTVQDTPDARIMSAFRRNLRNRVSDLQTVSQSSDATTFVVYYYGRADELADLIFAVAESTPGLERFNQVMTRGKSLVFNTGI
ncbi:MAG TPA: DUF6175 family protein [Spirochaetia bacterium]|nr:DUF6175 family protein [Spirochaetia bacterium]